MWANIYSLSIFLHRWRFGIYIKTAAERGEKTGPSLVILALQVSWVRAGGEGLLLLRREWQVSYSRIPSYQCGHGGSALISFLWTILKGSVVLLCTIKMISHFWKPLWPPDRHQRRSLSVMWIWPLMPARSGLVQKDLLFPTAGASSAHLRFSLALLRAIVPGWTPGCLANIAAPLLASRAAVPPLTGWLSPCLHPQHPFHSIGGSQHQHQSLNGNHGDDLLPQQWLATTVTAALGTASVDCCRTSLLLPWSPEMRPSPVSQPFDTAVTKPGPLLHDKMGF